jgi:hypothetical protein
VIGTGRKGVLPETNVWIYVSDQELGHEFDDIARELSIQWVCPPTILLGLARRPPSHKAERDRALRLYSRGYHRKRLSADAEYESRELIEVISRHRPLWLRRFTDLETVVHG